MTEKIPPEDKDIEGKKADDGQPPKKPGNFSLEVGSMLHEEGEDESYKVPSAEELKKQKKEEDTADESGGDKNALMRSLEVEKAEQQAKQQEQELRTDLIQEGGVDTLTAGKPEIEGREDGYAIDRQLGFDIVETAKSKEQQKSEHSLDMDASLGEEEKQGRSKARRREKARESWKNRFKEAIKGIQDTVKRMLQANTVIAKLIRGISAYRHHSLVRPGNQAGIFDNKMEKDITKGKKEEKKLKAMDDNGLKVQEFENFLPEEHQVDNQKLGRMEAGHTPMAGTGHSRGMGDR